MFEKLVASQIIDHVNQHKLLYSGQYGFRENHSCESALHDIISSMKRVLSRRTIALYLFIDFRKAFYIVCSRLLLIKLQHCFGFSQQSLNLIRDFFTNRTQKVKINDNLSSSQPISLGVAQGSSLGPLFFLLFINDLPFFLVNFLTTLFADDTTLSLEHKTLSSLLNLFYISFPYLIKWCYFNMLDINWNKTVIMFITNKYQQEIPRQISVNDRSIQVVNSFKLLGIIFPYFDYCSTITMYFPKETIQRLANCYNFCIFKLI